MKQKLAVFLTILVAVAGLIGVALFNQPPVGSVQAIGQDITCPEGDGWVKENWSENKSEDTYEVTDGKTIDQVCVKGGIQKKFFTEDDTQVCWEVDFKNGNTKVKIEEDDCGGYGKPDISHISYHVVQPRDVCKNIEGNQSEVPPYHYQDDGNCYEQTPVCTDKEAKNYDSEVDKTEYSADKVCEYNTIRWCFPTEEGEHKYEAQAIPDNQEPEEGFPWETGMDRYCEKPQDPSPSPTPQPQPEQPRSEPGPASAPVCSDSKPGKVANIYVDQGTPNDGKLEVRWLPEEPRGSKAHIRYSEVDGEWRYALLNTDNDGVEVIGDLRNGTHYWFQVAQVNGCMVGDYSRSFDPLP